jgi:hypothetical protein
MFGVVELRAGLVVEPLGERIIQRHRSSRLGRNHKPEWLGSQRQRLRDRHRRSARRGADSRCHFVSREAGEAVDGKQVGGESGDSGTAVDWCG